MPTHSLDIDVPHDCQYGQCFVFAEKVEQIVHRIPMNGTLYHVCRADQGYEGLEAVPFCTCTDPHKAAEIGAALNQAWVAKYGPFKNQVSPPPRMRKP